MHPFDRSLFWRSLAFALLAAGLCLVVVVATDEAQSTWAMRAARMAAFLPALAVLGGAVSLAQAHSRGELRALAALGASPFRAGLGAMAAGWVLGIVAVGLVLSPAADVASLFPRVVAHTPWIWDGAALVEPNRGVRVEPDGGLELSAAVTAVGAAAAPGRAMAAAAVAPLALVTPVWLSAPVTASGRVLVLGLTLAAAVLLSHAVGADRLNQAWLVAAALPLAAHAAVGHGRG